MSNTNDINSSQKTSRWVIKIGSALLTDNGQGLAVKALDHWVEQIAALKNAGHEVVLVSSGAVAEGVKRLGLTQRPDSLHQIQAAAAVGQAGLIQAYEARFKKFDLTTAQILLVHEDLSSRTRYLNARQTLQSLLDYGVIPIVNENDTVATDELRFGDNDTLAGQVVNLVEADTLLILTDQQGVFSDDPRSNPNATLITEVDVHDSSLDQAAKDGSGTLGRGGMTTKIKAARLAARSGASTIIANGLEDNIICRLANKESLGTKLSNNRKAIAPRKQWLSGSLSVKGSLTLDAGAVEVLIRSGSSLLPVGVRAVNGVFRRGELVSCVDQNNKEIARGLVNYNSDEAAKIAGQASDQLANILAYGGDPEIIHRDNLVVL